MFNRNQDELWTGPEWGDDEKMAGGSPIHPSTGSSRECIDMLVHIAGHGVNLLLNVAPDGQGEISDEQSLRLRHPKSAPIKSVTVNGKDWKDFNKECVILKGLTGTVAVTAKY
ncbi:MAG: alpha-L-fucosidase [Phycisphaerae bacterium]